MHPELFRIHEHNSQSEMFCSRHIWHYALSLGTLPNKYIYRNQAGSILGNTFKTKDSYTGAQVSEGSHGISSVLSEGFILCFDISKFDNWAYLSYPKLLCSREGDRMACI